jgi:glutamate-1-semialdehyde 2,1-aminomutase
MSSSRYAGSIAQNARSRRALAGGVATAIRANQDPVPICFERGAGARIWDIDGNEYIDYTLSYGPLLLGQSPRRVIDAVQLQLETGLGYGASHRFEAELAEAVCRTVPSVELCVFSTTGSEAVHAALRIARVATGRARVVKFLGHYHGWLDTINVGGPGQAVPGPGTSGQDPAAAAALTVCPWNDLDALESVLDDDVAAVIMEPLNVNGGCIAPVPAYLEAARELIHQAGALLVFDEVITGYRLALGGAQERFGVLPDLTVLGKALGGGFPISAVGGRTDVMDAVASRRVAHIGTFNANPICACAALAAITELEQNADQIYPALEKRARELATIFHEESVAAGFPIQVTHDVGVAHAFVSEKPVKTYEDALRADALAYRRFAAALLDHGVQVTQRGLLYVSTAHGSPELEETRRAVAQAAATLAESMATDAHLESKARV